MPDIWSLMPDSRGQFAPSLDEKRPETVGFSWLSWDEGSLSFDTERFKTVIQYVCWTCEDPRVLNFVTLNWILWYAERNECLATKRQLTGAIYTKGAGGPCAMPAYGAIKELVKEKMIVQREQSIDPERGAYFAVRQPNVDRLKAQQVAGIDAAIRTLCFDTNTTIPNRTALDRVFRLVRIGEHIPYFTVFAGSDATITHDDIDWAARQATGVARDAGDPEGAANPFVRLAYRAAVWRLRREPEIGISLPMQDSSYFVYRQSGRSYGLPDITIVYMLRLDQLMICGARTVDEE